MSGREEEGNGVIRGRVSRRETRRGLKNVLFRWWRRRRMRRKQRKWGEATRGKELNSSALAACSGGRQDGCRGQSTRPNMVIRTQLCPTFLKWLNQSLDDAGRTIYGERARISAPVSLMCCAGMSDAGLRPNTQTKPYGMLIHSQICIYSR